MSAKAKSPFTSGGTKRSDSDAVNEVRLVGRVSAPGVVKQLPSGAEVVQLRIVVDRPTGELRKASADVPRSPTVDTIDVACWKPQVRRRAMSWTGADVVEVRGALRRRFWRSPAGVASRYEVEAQSVRRLGPRG